MSRYLGPYFFVTNKVILDKIKTVWWQTVAFSALIIANMGNTWGAVLLRTGMKPPGLVKGKNR
jgi:hypothetical protein